LNKWGKPIALKTMDKQQPSPKGLDNEERKSTRLNEKKHETTSYTKEYL